MADISDVEQSLVDLVSGIVYPSGSASPSALPAAAPARIRRGWPLPAELDADLLAGLSNVTVWPRGGVEHNTTRYPVDYQEVSRATATLTCTVQDNQFTIGGTNNPAVRQFITVQVGPRVVVSYDPLDTDTLPMIAAQFVSLLAAQGVPAAAVGAVVTLQTGMSLRATVGVDANQIAEIRRQETMIQITLWCPTPALRDALAKLVEPVLAKTTFLVMPDQSATRLRYHMAVLSDDGDKIRLYRRDLIYTVEYATTLADVATEVTSVNAGVISNNGAGGIAPAVPANYPFPPPSPHVTLPSKTPPYTPLVPN